jgi:hypothetical protein
LGVRYVWEMPKPNRGFLLRMHGRRGGEQGECKYLDEFHR